MPQDIAGDQLRRDRIRTSLDENLFVEAGAGTGKTTALVGRIVELVTSGKAEMAGLAAITFTEAAAAELRDRVRRDLEDAATDETLDQAVQERRRRAVSELNAASIQTLHSFAQSLLREMPLEAGLPPGFETLDPIEADLRFRQAWDEWVDWALDSHEVGPKLAQALHFGVRLDRLREVAVALDRDHDVVAMAPVAPAPTIAIGIGQRLRGAVQEIERLRPLSMIGSGDPLYDHAGEVVALAQRLPEPGGATDPYQRAIMRLLGWRRLSTPGGNQKNWDRDDLTGENGCKLLKDVLRELERVRAEDIEALRLAALAPALEEVRRFVVELAQRRKAAGEATFHDLLIWARDMLRDNLDARRRFQRRFHHLLLDEFQDTDPIQAEIAFFLAGDPDDAAAGKATDWRDVPPVPGKLFMVGDPKQSIYRFRRADIATMAEARDRLVAESTPLQENFRSRQEIIAWVNHVFSQWMGAEDGNDLQAAYRDLIATLGAPDADEDAGLSPVHLMGGPVDGNAGEARRQEAWAAAALAQRVRADRWQVRDPVTQACRDADYRDVCLLIPSRTNLDALERALEDADVPYRIESESIVLGTEDVRQLLNCLRAIDSPGDQVALVAALRSSAFACSDVELLQFLDDGGRFDYQSPGGASGPVADAMKALRDYHEGCGFEPPDELIERFVRERQLVELSFNRRRPRERWRRLRYVAEQARAFQRAGGASLRGFLDWIEQQVEEGARAVESPAPGSDEDCVRIMTIHAAKGLEFPVVVLTGFGSPPRPHRPTVIVDRSTGRIEVSLALSERGHMVTSGYAEVQERESAAAAGESVRLTYVACTRARDYLVVSLFRSRKGAESSRAGRLEALCSDRPDLFTPLDWQGLVEASNAHQQEPPAAPATPARDFPRLRAQWVAQRNDVLAGAARPQAQAVTAIAQEARGQSPGLEPPDVATSEKVEVDDGEISYRRGRGSTNLGRAVHAVLQSIDLETGADLESICRAQAEAEGVGSRVDDVLGLAHAALESKTVKDLVTMVRRGSAKYYREVFVSAALDGRLLEGFIDLLIDGPEGISIVDYKTDSLTEQQVRELGPEYQVQIGLYAWAVGQTTGRPVHDATLLFLRPREERAFTDVSGLIARALDAARQ